MLSCSRVEKIAEVARDIEFCKIVKDVSNGLRVIWLYAKVHKPENSIYFITRACRLHARNAANHLPSELMAGADSTFKQEFLSCHYLCKHPEIHHFLKRCERRQLDPKSTAHIRWVVLVPEGFAATKRPCRNHAANRTLSRTIGIPEVSRVSCRRILGQLNCLRSRRDGKKEMLLQVRETACYRMKGIRQHEPSDAAPVQEQLLGKSIPSSNTDGREYPLSNATPHFDWYCCYCCREDPRVHPTKIYE